MVKLEVGKYYKGQNGDKWKCVHNFDYGGSPFILVSDNRGMPVVARFSPQGLKDTLSSPYHVISEWVEPVEHEVEVEFYKDEKGTAGFYCYHVHGSNATPIAKVKIKFTEGEGL